MSLVKWIVAVVINTVTFSSSTSDSLDSGLTLFTSMEDQQALEQTPRAENQPGLEENTVEMINRFSNEPPVLSVAPNRYDGLLMKGKRLLGIWFDGVTVTDIQEYTGADRVQIGSGGWLTLQRGKRSATLYPGNYFSSAEIAIVNPMLSQSKLSNNDTVSREAALVAMEESSAEVLEQREIRRHALENVETDQIDAGSIEPVQDVESVQSGRGS